MAMKKLSKKDSVRELSQKSEKQSVKNNVSIILGVLSVLLSVFAPYFVAITGVLGIIFAYVEKGRVPRRSSTWAFVLNLVGIFLAIIILTISFFAVLYYGSQLNLTSAA